MAATHDREARSAAVDDPHASASDVVGYAIEHDERLGIDGFLALRRMKLRTVRRDGSRSAVFQCDYVERRRGLDAVVVGLYSQDEDGEVQVLLRRGLRPPVYFGRDGDVTLPVAESEAARRLFVTEVVAGLIEAGDHGEAGVRHRAADEAWEEAGFRLDPAHIEPLGPPMFASPGLCAERMHFYCARVEPGARHPQPPVGDGSPMEEGSSQRFVPLDEALLLCDRGEIEDIKTELVVRRLAARLTLTAAR